MNAWLFGLLVARVALAADPLPYDLKKAQTNGCLANTGIKVSEEEKSLCQDSMEKMLYEVRYSYGVGERPEEDGCQLGDTQLQFLVFDNVGTLERNSKGQLRANLTCYPDSQPRYMWYIDYDPNTEKVVAVIHAGQ